MKLKKFAALVLMFTAASGLAMKPASMVTAVASEVVSEGPAIEADNTPSYTDINTTANTDTAANTDTTVNTDVAEGENTNTINNTSSNTDTSDSNSKNKVNKNKKKSKAKTKKKAKKNWKN